MDHQIQRLLNSFGSWEKAIQENVIIVTSAHGQTNIGKEKNYNIDLDNLLEDFKRKLLLQQGEKQKLKLFLVKVALFWTLMDKGGTSKVKFLF